MSGTETRENWTEKQDKFIKFLARGKETIGGEKRTMAQFAQAIGVNPNTLYEWQRLPGFAKALFEETLKYNAKHLPQLVKAQMAAASKRGKGGETPAFMAIMRQYELLKTDKIDVTSDGKAMPQPVMPLSDLKHD